MSTKFIVQIKDQYGKRHDELLNDIMEARSRMCDIVKRNNENGIEDEVWDLIMEASKPKEDTKIIDFEKIFESIHYLIWTSELHKLGHNNTDIEDEYFIYPTKLESFIGMKGVAKIRIRIRD